MNIKLTTLKQTALAFVKDIYDYYILHSTATFHMQPISIPELKKILPAKQGKYASYLVEYEGQPCGYCYLGRYKPREAYDRTAEITLYLKPDFLGKGIGKQVMAMLEEIARQNQLAVLIGGITAENQASIRLFERCGYEKCAHLKQVGEKFGRILDVVYYQKIL